VSEVKKFRPIVPFLRPCALESNAKARQTFTQAASQRVNGWAIATTEAHRVSAVKGGDLVHFAPAGSDFDNPQALSEAEHAAAMNEALIWCKSHSLIVCRENVIACLREQITKTKRKINALRKQALESKEFSEKIRVHERLKAEENRLSNRRRNIFVAEDAIDASIRAASTIPFAEMAEWFPDAHALLERVISEQSAGNATVKAQTADCVTQ